MSAGTVSEQPNLPASLDVSELLQIPERLTQALNSYNLTTALAGNPVLLSSSSASVSSVIFAVEKIGEKKKEKEKEELPPLEPTLDLTKEEVQKPVDLRGSSGITLLLENEDEEEKEGEKKEEKETKEEEEEDEDDDDFTPEDKIIAELAEELGMGKS
jgi:ribosomal protein L12E/L44/L45/RPP1/RPP2